MMNMLIFLLVFFKGIPIYVLEFVKWVHGNKEKVSNWAFSYHGHEVDDIFIGKPKFEEKIHVNYSILDEYFPACKFDLY